MRESSDFNNEDKHQRNLLSVLSTLTREFIPFGEWEHGVYCITSVKNPPLYIAR